MRPNGVRQAAIGIGVLLALGGPAVPAGAQAWTAQEIVDRAVARADAQREAQDDVRYLATFEAITERLNGDGEVEETERETYEQYPLEGVIYEELVAREGMPLTAADERKEQERRREFGEEVRERQAQGIDPHPEDENRVKLHEDFISRYQYAIVGEEVHDSMKSHTAYLTFNLPARMAFENITSKVEAVVRQSGVTEGLVLCNAMHSTASVFINDDESGLHEDGTVNLTSPGQNEAS